MATTKWKTQREAFIESLSYLDGRKKGKITSLKTPWESFNKASTDGLEWHSTTVIGARPATGKTLIKDLLVTGAFTLNPLSNFRVLEFQFEMMGKTAAIREYAKHLGTSYKYLCSADGTLTDADFAKCKAYAKEKLKFPIDIVENPCNMLEFTEIIEEYMFEHSSLNEDSKRLYKNTIITLDHSLLLKKGPGERDKFETLYVLGETLTALKRKYPIAFIILSQLNRDIDSPKRNEDGEYGNYILESDIFGADALLQHADLLVGLNRPGKQKIQYYGPERFIIDRDQTILAMHFLKCRNGEPGISFFRTAFDKMTMYPMDAPPKQEKRLRI